MQLLYCKDCNRLYTEYTSVCLTVKTHDIILYSTDPEDESILKDMEPFRDFGQEYDYLIIKDSSNTTLSELVQVEEENDWKYACPEDQGHDIKMIPIDISNLSLKEIKEIYSLRIDYDGYHCFDIPKLTVEELFKLKKLIVESDAINF